MSTTGTKPPVASDVVNIEVDGKPCQVRKGSMIIHATDALGAYVPRFCYHPKLTIAANCRMCLVEVEKAPKPLPACATPVMEGMKVSTRSPKALAAQKATMEFLLINHPLDCPICDQGGECELQDLAMGYGSGSSRYTEQKRVVADQDIGPLISTDMTRCIHCTRCVRFGSEVAGSPELGATGRGENMRIGTYVAKSIDHELSGNVIDLCPVGALNSKPFRMRGRSWEMQQHAQVSPHDALGSNLWAHTLRGELLRVVPRENEQVNETWISDRDRFGYEGLRAADRLLEPMVKQDGKWRSVPWDVALEAAAGVLKQAGAGLATLVAPGVTLEEAYLAQKLTRALGSDDVDHRLAQNDFRDDATAPAAPLLGGTLADLEQVGALLAVGLDLRKHAPLLGHRVRKAALAGAAVAIIGLRRQALRFPVLAQLAGDDAHAVRALAQVANALAAKLGKPLPAHLAAAAAAGSSDEATRIAAALAGAERRAVLLGPWALANPQLADLRALAEGIADLCGASFGQLAPGANSAGAHLAGAIPQRGADGASRKGRDARQQLAEPRPGHLLVGVEPELDSALGATAAATLARAAAGVVAITPFASESMKRYATVLLPASSFGESAGTFVSCSGEWQSFAGATAPPGQARPGWKVLRVLGNLVGAEGFDHASAEQVRDELRALRGARPADHRSSGAHRIALPAAGSGLRAVAEHPIYAGDALVRRSAPLQATADGRAGATLRVSASTAERLGLAAGSGALLRAGATQARLPVTIDDGLPDDLVVVPRGVAAAAELGPLDGPISVARG